MGDVADYQERDVEGGEEEEEEGGEERRRKRKREDADEMARLDLLVPNIELATGCSPAHLPGGPPSVLAQTLTQRVLRLLHASRMVGMAPLRLWFDPSDGGAAGQMDTDGKGEEGEMARARVKAFWTLYIDILFISLDGNAFDAAWFAVLAALKDTVLPRAWWDGDREMVLCSDDVGEGRRLEIGDVPTPLSFGVFVGERGEGRWVLADMDGFEEALCREVGTVVVGGEGRVVRIEKSGGVGVGMVEVGRLVELAVRRREEWMGVLGAG